MALGAPQAPHAQILNRCHGVLESLVVAHGNRPRRFHRIGVA
jgi:hypothetical protein